MKCEDFPIGNCNFLGWIISFTYCLLCFHFFVILKMTTMIIVYNYLYVLCENFYFFVVVISPKWNGEKRVGNSSNLNTFFSIPPRYNSFVFQNYILEDNYFCFLSLTQILWFEICKVPQTYMSVKDARISCAFHYHATCI